MTYSNHMLAGASIALVVGNPVLASLGALASHYLLDAMPHFGYQKKGYKEALRHELTYVTLAVSTVHAALIVSMLIGGNLYFALFCAMLAVAPDIVATVGYFGYVKRHHRIPNWMRLHAKKLHEPIQTVERPWGLIVEIVFAIVVTASFVTLIVS